MFYSPLRYPGGKGKLTEFMKYMIDQLGHSGGTYIEPLLAGQVLRLNSSFGVLSAG